MKDEHGKQGRRRTTEQVGWKLLEAFGAVWLMVAMSGCWLFDKNKHTAEEPAETLVAPQAAFTVDKVSGQAPLAVTFSDQSEPGSAVITGWQWDFGDGATSTEANPSHTYASAGSYSVSLSVSSEHGSDSHSKTDYIVVAVPDVALQLSVVDQKGRLLAGVTATSEQYEITSASDTESGLALTVSPSDQAGVIRLAKDGYLNQFVFLESLQVNGRQRVAMMERPPAILINAFLGGTYTSKDGASVKIPAESLVRADGTRVNGQAELYITPIDISDDVVVDAFPGSFYGKADPNAEAETLFSYGVVDITIEENGETLQLAEGAQAELMLPLYATKSYKGEDLTAGDRIPLWYLDEASGHWILEDEGVVVEDPLAPNGLALAANTTHFTAFNSDINPPGYGGSSGGGGGGSAESYLCDLTVYLQGAETGKRYTYRAIYSRAGWPASGQKREFTYDGSPITQRMLRGSLLTVVISNGDVEGQERIACGSNNAVEMTISLGDVPPEFIDWNFRVEPVFSKNADDLYEIAANKIYAGGYFIGAETVVVTSDFIQTPLILGNGIFHELDYTKDDTSPTLFQGRIENEFGFATDESLVTFVGAKEPVPGYVYAIANAQDMTTSIYWNNYEGVDSVRVYELGQNTNDAGNLILDALVGTSSFTHSFPQQMTGYLRIEYENQYGTTTEIVPVSGENCIPGSELCGPL